MSRRVKQIALVPGDGIGPEMSHWATLIAGSSARALDGIDLEWVEAPMGWSAFDRTGNSLPPESLETVMRLGIVLFGGVGDFSHDEAAKKFPKERPETKVIMGLRDAMGLLVNYRPVEITPSLSQFAGVRADRIPPQGIAMHCLRHTLGDVYFGNQILGRLLPPDAAKAIGYVEKHAVTSNDPRVTMLAYYDRETVLRFFRHAFEMAKRLKLPLICVDKSNIDACSQFWREICLYVHRDYPDVQLSHLYIDAACALLFDPAKLHGVIALGNLHGDIFTDGAVAAAGSMGMMCSSSVNPWNGMAMFERGAGTAPTLAGKNIANPLGAILTAAMLNEHIGATMSAAAIKTAVQQTLAAGYRTADIFREGTGQDRPLNTDEMASEVMSRLGI